ncbi:MAG: PTS sugar transporter subunit IIA [Erysipelotrichaceae bacterium]|nr:PTS sugar transporter subunit IIA [Erysipelotrichaceae bacterium]
MEMLVEKNKIAAKIQADDWQDVIRKAGQLLIDSGDIEEGYIDHMIDSVRTLGPYMVIAKGFALAHAAPCEEVKNTSISLINLKDPVNFGSGNDPVRVVMCLACKDREAHIEKLQKIATKRMEKDMIDLLAKCETDTDLYDLINKGKEDQR